MNFDEDIEKRSTWTNVALFMIGIVILAFMPKLQKENEKPAETSEFNLVYQPATSGLETQDVSYYPENNVELDYSAIANNVEQKPEFEAITKEPETTQDELAVK